MNMTVTVKLMTWLVVCVACKASYLKPPQGPETHYGAQPIVAPYVEPYKYAPRPYNYAYGVHDEYTGTKFTANEESDGGNVKGSYSVLLPDGRTQTVTYWADPITGFHADVTYTGTPYYPPPPYNIGHKGPLGALGGGAPHIPTPPLVVPHVAPVVPVKATVHGPYKAAVIHGPYKPVVHHHGHALKPAALGPPKPFKASQFLPNSLDYKYQHK